MTTPARGGCRDRLVNTSSDPSSAHWTSSSANSTAPPRASWVSTRLTPSATARALDVGRPRLRVVREAGQPREVRVHGSGARCRLAMCQVCDVPGERLRDRTEQPTRPTALPHAREHQHLPSARPLAGLAEQPRLPETRLADDMDEGRTVSLAGRQGTLDHLQLVLTTHECRCRVPAVPRLHLLVLRRFRLAVIQIPPTGERPAATEPADPRLSRIRRMELDPRIRPAARAVVTDPDRRVLLVHFSFPTILRRPTGSGPAQVAVSTQENPRGSPRARASRGARAGDRRSRPADLVEGASLPHGALGRPARHLLLGRGRAVRAASEFSDEELRAENLDAMRWWSYDEVQAAQAAYDPGRARTPPMSCSPRATWPSDRGPLRPGPPAQVLHIDPP